MSTTFLSSNFRKGLYGLEMAYGTARKSLLKLCKKIDHWNEQIPDFAPTEKDVDMLTVIGLRADDMIDADCARYIWWEPSPAAVRGVPDPALVARDFTELTSRYPDFSRRQMRLHRKRTARLLRSEDFAEFQRANRLLGPEDPREWWQICSVYPTEDGSNTYFSESLPESAYTDMLEEVGVCGDWRGPMPSGPLKRKRDDLDPRTDLQEPPPEKRRKVEHTYYRKVSKSKYRFTRWSA